MTTVNDSSASRSALAKELFPPRTRDAQAPVSVSAISAGQLAAREAEILEELALYQGTSRNLLTDPRMQQLLLRMVKDIALLAPTMALKNLSPEDLNNLGLVAAISTEGGLLAKLWSAAKALLLIGPIRGLLTSESFKTMLADGTGARIDSLREGFQEFVSLASGTEFLPAGSKQKVVAGRVDPLPRDQDSADFTGAGGSASTRQSRRTGAPLLLEGVVLPPKK